MVNMSGMRVGLGSVPGHSRHDVFDVKTWLSMLGTVHPS